MQRILHRPTVRASGRLILLLAALVWLCFSAGAVIVPTIGPIPNQVYYVGSPALVVPLRIDAPPGSGEFKLIISNPSRRNIGQFGVTGAGTNRFLTLQPQPVTAPTVALGNTTLSVSAIAGGITNQTSFILTVLPDEFTALTYSAQFTIVQPSWGDFNGDGALDLAGNLLTGTPGSVEIELNAGGNASFMPLASPGFGKGSGIVPADVDGDGDLDAIVLGSLLPRPLLINNIDKLRPPHFASVPLALPLTNLVAAVWADFDGDGDLDLVVAGTDVAGRVALPTRWLRNVGGGSLVLVDPALPAAAGPVVAVDFDGDGAEDLLLTNTGLQGDTPMLLHNDGEGSFADTGTQFPHGLVTAAGWTDFNGDGIPDVWLQYRSGPGTTVTNNQLVLLQQQADGQFVETLRLGSDVMRQAGAPAWGDFDHDGTPDFVAPVNVPAYQVNRGNPTVPTVLGTNSVLTVWHNDGTGHFVPRGFIATNTPNLYLAAGDADGDGALDLAFPGPLGKKVVYNPNRPVNRPPAAPDGLQAFAEGRNLFFFWNESSDPNQTAPLTYNLRVGTRPGANDIVASMSLNSGTRQLVAPGNCEFSTFRDLRLPLPGPGSDVLYWSVQAVDNSFVGSVFAPEQTLAVNVPGNMPPVITGLSNVVVIAQVTPTSLYRMNFSATDDRTRPGNLKLQVTASNPLLFPADSFFIPTEFDSGLQPPAYAVLFAPSPGLLGESDISVTATDGQGLSTTGTFHVTVVRKAGPTSPPSLQLSAPAGDGALRFSLQNAALPGLGLEQSEDLLHWSPVSELQYDSNSLPAFSVPQPPDKDRLYYRLRTAQ